PAPIQVADVFHFSDVTHGPADSGLPTGASRSSTPQPPTASTGGLGARIARGGGPGRRRALIAGAVAVAVLIGTVAYGATARSKPKAAGLGSIQHIVVVYMENWSFDSLYGKFPGANGIASATRAQVDRNGVSYITLPQALNSTKAEQPAGGSPAAPNPPDARFPANLPNAPFDIAPYVPPTDNTGDLGVGFYQEQAQIDGGRMDRFVANSGAGGLTMGYYDATNFPLGAIARQYTLADNFFHAAYGGSMLNHFWLIGGATPQWSDAPASMRATLDANGHLVKDGAVSPDGFLV